MSLGLPDGIRACLFDLDGVLTQTAKVHAAAWKRMFDEYLRARAERTGEPFREFDLVSDYGTYVDGKPRADGVRSFLESRGIELKEGGADDPPSTETIAGLGNRDTEPDDVPMLATGKVDKTALRALLRSKGDA